MSAIGSVATVLGQEVMPQIAAEIFSDTMTIRGKTLSQGADGGQVKTASPSDHLSIPCSYEPMQAAGGRLEQAEQMRSTQQYRVTFPTHYTNGMRINLNPSEHRLIVDPRGTEPEKTFRILSVRDDLGVIYETACEREN